MKKNVVLVGFMGSGKSTVGRRVAKLLNRPFIDSDNLIEERFDRIYTIFRTQGERQFRNIESSIIEEALVQDKLIVLSVGGGGFCSRRTAQICLDNAVVFYLNCTFEICYNRIRYDDNRPLVEKGKKWLMQLYKSRLSYYSNASFAIDTNKSVNEAADELILLYKNKLLEK